MIKGKYVGTVTICFSLDEADKTLQPFDKIKENITKDLNSAIKEILEDGVGEESTTITVEQQFADVYRVES